MIMLYQIWHTNACFFLFFSDQINPKRNSAYPLDHRGLHLTGYKYIYICHFAIPLFFLLWIRSNIMSIGLVHPIACKIWNYSVSCEFHWGKSCSRQINLLILQGTGNICKLLWNISFKNTQLIFRSNVGHYEITDFSSIPLNQLVANVCFKCEVSQKHILKYNNK